MIVLLVVVGLGVIALVVVGALAWLVLPPLLSTSALHRGDYDAAVFRARLARFAPAGGLYLAGMLIHADRLDEAEALLRRSVDRGGPGALTLALVAHYQGRLDEAEAWARKALEGGGSPAMHAVLADVLASAGRADEGSLVHLDAMVAEAGDPWLAPNQLAEHLAIEARVLAVLGRPDAAIGAAVAALEAMRTDIPFAVGETRWRVGLAFRALGDEERARTELRAAAEGDPTGVYGRLARDALG